MGSHNAPIITGKTDTTKDTPKETTYVTDSVKGDNLRD